MQNASWTEPGNSHPRALGLLASWLFYHLSRLLCFKHGNEKSEVRQEVRQGGVAFFSSSFSSSLKECLMNKEPTSSCG